MAAGDKMFDVVIAGIGQTPVGEHWEISLRELAVEAIQTARHESAGLVPRAMFIGNMLGSTLSHQANLGSLLTDYTGLRGIEGTTVEAAGASGGAAFRMGYLAVASGMVDVALVVGTEKFTDVVGPQLDSALAQTVDSDYEAVHGITPTTQAALLMKRYLCDYNLQHAVFAGFPMTAHANAVNNSNAIYRKAISIETYENSEVMNDPLNLFDMAPFVDGAAALLLTTVEHVPAGFAHPLVRVSGSSIVTDTLAMHDRQDPLAWLAASFSVERACRQAGIIPEDVDLFEYYDAFSIFAALSLEAAGFARRGEGWKLALDGQIGLQGRLPVATMGGLKARGNPGGATGVYQAIEAVLQLRGEAGKNQVVGARRALIQSLGGPASTAVTHVLERIG
jgi:acetyl-CoA C-acetyltransferase